MLRSHRPRIVIADDHLFVAEACNNLLRQEYEVIGIITNGAVLISEVARLQPDVLILDISMPPLDGLNVGREIRQANRAVKLIYLTMHSDPCVAAEALRLGAVGYVLKSSTAKQLAVAVQKALRGERFISPTINRDALDNELRMHSSRPTDDGDITDRQKEVLALLVQGMTLKRVASVLGVQFGTVCYHKYDMMRRLGFRSSAELYRYAILHKMLPPSDPAAVPVQAS